MTRIDENSENPPRGMSRRSVVKTAGTAAWAAPVIVAATAAPAMAATGPAAFTIANNSGPSRADAALDGGEYTITNQNTLAGNVTVTVTLVADGNAALDFGGSTPAAVAGFSAPTPPVGQTFVYVSTAAVAGNGGTINFAPDFTLAPTPGSGTITVSVAPPAAAGMTTVTSTFG